MKTQPYIGRYVFKIIVGWDICKVFGLTQEELNRIMFYFSHFLIKISAKAAVGRALIPG